MSLWQHWKFDDMSGGVTVDSGPNGYTGTLSGTNPPTRVAGPPGTVIPYAASFDGTGYIAGPSGSGYRALSAPTLAWGCWFKTTIATTGRQTLVNSYNDSYWFEVLNSTYTGELAQVYGSFQSHSNVGVSTNVWAHLFFVQNGVGGACSAYKNGELVTTTGTLGGWSQVAGSSLYIGCRTTSSQFVTGQIADLRIYDDANWTADSVRNLYRSTLVNGFNSNLMVSD